jgi:hypothetical protein
MRGDDIPPPTPAAPEVASSLIAMQITHRLGAAAGGTFNLPADMHHFEVHVGPEPLFTASAATLIGKINANNGMIVSADPGRGHAEHQRHREHLRQGGRGRRGREPQPTRPSRCSRARS